MNPMDRAIAGGAWKTLMPATFPMALGVDVAGTVEQLGEGSRRFSVGEEVFEQFLIPPSDRRGRTPTRSRSTRIRRRRESPRNWIRRSRRPRQREA